MNINQLAASIAVVALVAIGVALPAEAGTPPDDTFEIELPDLGVIRERPGIGVTVASGPTPPDLVGDTCDIEIMTGNNSSVHEGTTIEFLTYDTNTVDGASVRMFDVEREQGAVTAASGSLVLQRSLRVTVFTGPEWIASLDGAVITLTCVDPPTTTTTTYPSEPPTTSVVPPETTTPPTTTRPPLTVFCEDWFEWYPEECGVGGPPTVTVPPAPPAPPVVTVPDLTG